MIRIHAGALSHLSAEGRSELIAPLLLAPICIQMGGTVSH